MAVFRVERKHGFTVVAQCIFMDYTLSAKAKGILVQMLSVNEKQWDFTLKGLTKLFTDGLDSLRKGVHELEEHGYVVRKRVRDARGRLCGTEYFVYESPHLNESFKEEKTVKEKPKKISTKSQKSVEKPVENPTNEIFSANENPTQDIPTQANPMPYILPKESSTDLIKYCLDSNPIPSEKKSRTWKGEDAMSEREKFAEQIYTNIGYEILAENPKINTERLHEITQLIIDTGSSRRNGHA